MGHTTAKEHTLQYLKVHGAGNDFVLIPDLADALTLTAPMVVALADRHRGIGGDGVIRAGAPREGVEADVFMDYRNADGGIAEMCGNGVRTIAKWIADRWVPGRTPDVPAPVTGDHDVVLVDTRAGVKRVAVQRGDDGLVQTCTVDMGAPVVIDEDRQLDLPDGGTAHLVTVSMGNPHAVLLVDHVPSAPVTTLGPLIERHESFPEGTNVEFIHVADRGTVEGRIWERGVGETLASGTGGSAMAVAAITRGLADRVVDVRLPGGVLTADWTGTTLLITGPAEEVGEGWLTQGFMARAEIPHDLPRMAHGGVR